MKDPGPLSLKRCEPRTIKGSMMQHMQPVCMSHQIVSKQEDEAIPDPHEASEREDEQTSSTTQVACETSTRRKNVGKPIILEDKEELPGSRRDSEMTECSTGSVFEEQMGEDIDVKIAPNYAGTCPPPRPRNQELETHTRAALHLLLYQRG